MHIQPQLPAVRRFPAGAVYQPPDLFRIDRCRARQPHLQPRMAEGHRRDADTPLAVADGEARRAGQLERCRPARLTAYGRPWLRHPHGRKQRAEGRIQVDDALLAVEQGQRNRTGVRLCAAGGVHGAAEDADGGPVDCRRTDTKPEGRGGADAALLPLRKAGFIFLFQLLIIRKKLWLRLALSSIDC